MTPFVDAYGVLGVPASASQAELKAAHRRLVRRHHPDLARPEQREAATRRTQDLNLAYGLVRDPAARARYDEIYRHQLAPTPRPAAPVPDPFRAQWEAAVRTAGRWSGAWWARHRTGLARAAVRARVAGVDAVARVLWLVSVAGWALLGLAVVIAAQRLLGVNGPFSWLAGLLGGGMIGSHRGWLHRLRLAGLRELAAAGRGRRRVLSAAAAVAVAAGLALDNVLF